MKLAFVLILAFNSLLGFAQEGTEVTPPEIQDDIVLHELTEEREARQKNLEAVNKVVGPVAEEKSAEDFTAVDLMNTESLKKIENILKEAKMSQYPPELVREKILEAFKGNPIEGYVRTSPKLQNFMVDFIRDDKALLSAIAIFKNKERLKYYLYIWIVIMFAAYYTKRLFISKYWKGAVRTFAALLFSLTISTITFSSFCLLFREEMKPILSIIRKHL